MPRLATVDGVLIGKLCLWLARTNAWIVAPDGPGGECVLIDAPAEPDRILAYLALYDLRLAAILVTHGHVDHVGGVSSVASAAGADRVDPLPVHIHPDDRHMLADPVGTSGAFGEALLAEGLDTREPELVFGLDDGQRVSGAGMSFVALHTPGHTPGSTCLLLDAEGEAPMLWSGDHLFAGSIGRTDLPGGSQEALMASMEAKILPLPDEVRVMPGHGATTTVGRERATNPYLRCLGARH